MKTLGEKLRDIREQKGFPQKVIADHLGLHRTNYSRIENNIQKLTPEQIKLFCEFCNVSADYLLGITSSDKVVYTTQTKKDINRRLTELYDLVNQDNKKAR